MAEFFILSSSGPQPVLGQLDPIAPTELSSPAPEVYHPSRSFCRARMLPFLFRPLSASELSCQIHLPLPESIGPARFRI